MIQHESWLNNINDNIEKCRERIEYHNSNAHNAKLFNNLISTSNIMLAASCSLCMTLMTIEEYPTKHVTIAASMFSFVITCSSKIKDDYSFLALSYQHFNSSDSYADIKMELEKLTREFDIHEYEKLLIKLEATIQKSHIQSVRNCKWFFCCFS